MNKFYKISKEQYIKDCENRFAYEDIKLPQRATKYSAGYDFYSPIDFVLKAGDTIKIPSGIRVELDNDKFLAIVPRSSLGFKYRLQLDNCVGIIDSDYSYSDNEGHIWIKLTNDSREGKELHIRKGEAIVQGIILIFYKTYDDSSVNTRKGGLGSTTKQDYSLPLGYDMYGTNCCRAKCKTPCGRKRMQNELIDTSSDLTNHCLRFQVDLDQFDSVFEAAYVAKKATE